MRVVPVAGVSFRPEAHEDPSFDPGLSVALVPEPDNEHDPNAVGIWNEQRTLQAGYVPREVAPELDRRRAGRVALARRGRAPRADRARRCLDRAPAIDFRRCGVRVQAPRSRRRPDRRRGRPLARRRVGDEVTEDQPLVEIQTDKTTVEIPSPAAGKVAQILVEEGKVVPVGTILVVIGEDGAAPAVEEQPRAEPAPSARPRGQAPRRAAGWTSARDAARPAARSGARGRPRRRSRAQGRKDG